ncbi:hypothetical protein LIER_21623 [Lithospermum erythrorhizon]|uniref:Uncharacterized protein n=1 Tax=Lithospermum erythrorhizon TaxID=34254 RepID=A0AAV3QQV7_LITER
MEQIEDVQEDHQNSQSSTSSREKNVKEQIMEITCLDSALLGLFVEISAPSYANAVAVNDQQKTGAEGKDQQETKYLQPKQHIAADLQKIEKVTHCETTEANAIIEGVKTSEIVESASKHHTLNMSNQEKEQQNNSIQDKEQQVTEKGSATHGKQENVEDGFTVHNTRN